MSHNLEITERGASLIYNRQEGSVWHRLGVPVDGTFTAQEAMEKAGLDFTVETTQMQHTLPDGEIRDCGDRTVIRRTDTWQVLGTATKNYVEIQNKDGFGFFDSLVKDGEAKYTSAGVLGNGYRVFLTASTKRQIQIAGDDVVEPFVVLDMPHTGKDASSYYLSSVRPICQNTLTASIRGVANVGRIRHRGDVKAKLNMAGEVLRCAGVYFDELGGAFRYLAGVEVKGENILTEYLIETVTGRKHDWLKLSDEDEIGVRNRNKINRARMLFDGAGRGSSLKSARGTWWGAYNAITELVDHTIASGRKKELEYAGYGAGKDLKQRGLKLALEYATHA